MKRLLAVVVAVTVMAGCKGTGRTAPVDPFFGPTTIEPPRTGWNTGHATPDPYYSKPRQAAASSGAASAARGVSFQPNRSDPAATWKAPSPETFRRASHNEPAARPDSASRRTAAAETPIRIPPSARRQLPYVAGDGAAGGSRPKLSFTPETTPPPSPAAGTGAVASAQVPADSPRLVESLPPRPDGQANRFEPARLPRAGSAEPATPPRSSRRVIDIMDLPPVSTADAWQKTGSVRPASYLSDAQEAATGVSNRRRPFPRRADQTTQTAASAATFGHDADYRRLRGQLEYSQIDRCWRLRYLPVGGQTDRYGGSVLLEETPRLSGFERGDFVEITGRISSLADGKTTFAPHFEVAEIRALPR